MPLKNDFVRANRLDLAKVVERWGGLPQLAEVNKERAPEIATTVLRREDPCFRSDGATLWHTWQPPARDSFVV